MIISCFFKKLATEKKSGYQTLMNDVLREYIKKTVNGTARTPCALGTGMNCFG
jgi:hypothetical protein